MRGMNWLDEVFRELSILRPSTSSHEELVEYNKVTDAAKSLILAHLEEAMLRVVGQAHPLTHYYNEEYDDYDVMGTVGDSWDDTFEAGTDTLLSEQLQRIQQEIARLRGEM